MNLQTKGVFSKLSLFAYTITQPQRIAARNGISQANRSSNQKPFARETRSHFLATSPFLFFFVASTGDADQDAYGTSVRIPGKQERRLQLWNRQTCLIPTLNTVSQQQPGCQTNAESVWHWTVDRFILRGSYEICLPINFLKFTTNSLKT